MTDPTFSTALAASQPASPRVFLIDGYALIYRAFFALISRPLTTARGENTSAAWGIVNFLQRLLANHRPEYLGWVTLHELGHALGLGHATNLLESTDLMGYGWPDLGDPVLSNCDLDALFCG